MKMLADFWAALNAGIHAFCCLRRLRKLHASLNGKKCKITAVGELTNNPAGGVYIGPGWSFISDGTVPMQRIDLNGQFYFFGYTPDELREIHAHRADWVS